MRLYLAGPISGLSYAEATGFRTHVTNRILARKPDWTVLNPMAGKKEPHKGSKFTTLGYDHSPLLSATSIVQRDAFCVKTSDLVYVDLHLAPADPAQRMLIGTSVEIGWASANGIPIVAWLPPSSPYQHLFLHELCNCQPTFEDALEVLLSFN